MKLGEQIKIFRKKRAKITQPELAKKAGFSKSLIINYENEHTQVISNIDKIMEALGARILIIGKDDEIFIKTKEE